MTAETDKFLYGTDVNIYLEKALEKIKRYYPKTEKDVLSKTYTYAIEEEGGRHVFVRYYAKKRRVFDFNGDEFIELIICDHWESIAEANWRDNPVVERYELPLKGGITISDWHLEQYVFCKHKQGNYSSSVTAGNREAGGSRSYYISPTFLEGTFEEFLEKYNDMVLFYFEIDNTILNDMEGLKAFLGFSVRKE